MIYADVEETDMKKMLTKPGDLNALSRRKKNPFNGTKLLYFYDLHKYCVWKIALLIYI